MKAGVLMAAAQYEAVIERKCRNESNQSISMKRRKDEIMAWPVGNAKKRLSGSAAKAGGFG